MKTLFVTAAAVAGLSGAAFAQDAEITFEDLDTNMDGVLSLEEVQAVAPDVTQEEFTRHDEDADGALNETEFDEWVAAKAEAEDDGEGDGY